MSKSVGMKRTAVEAFADEESSSLDKKICHRGFIEFNVGGTKFQTSKEIFYPKRDCSNFFTGLFSSLDIGMDLMKDNEGRIFLDRSAECFGIILDFLRTGFVQLKDPSIRLVLLPEFDFYQITPPKSLSEGPHVLHISSHYGVRIHDGKKQKQEKGDRKHIAMKFVDSGKWEVQHFGFTGYYADDERCASSPDEFILRRKIYN